MTQALPVIQTPLQPGDSPSACAASDGSRSGLTYPQALELARRNGVGLLDSQAAPDEHMDEPQQPEV
jgi:hypothetical protein